MRQQTRIGPIGAAHQAAVPEVMMMPSVIGVEVTRRPVGEADVSAPNVLLAPNDRFAERARCGGDQPGRVRGIRGGCSWRGMLMLADIARENKKVKGSDTLLATAPRQDR
jgi:hypothetical protein